MLSYLQRSLQPTLALTGTGDNSTSSSSNDSIDTNHIVNNEADTGHERETIAAAAEEIINRIVDTDVIVAVTRSENVSQKLFTVDSPNETSSSAGTENDFEIVSNESSPIPSPTIMSEHDDNSFGVGEEAEDTDKFTTGMNNPRNPSDMELREKRSRLRWENAYTHSFLYVYSASSIHSHVHFERSLERKKKNRKKNCPSSIRELSS